jgi:hypothetical protein
MVAHNVESFDSSVASGFGRPVDLSQVANLTEPKFNDHIQAMRTLCVYDR